MKKMLLVLVAVLVVSGMSSSSEASTIAKDSMKHVCAGKKFTKQDMLVAYKMGYIMAGGNWENFKHEKVYTINWKVLMDAAAAHKQ